MRIRNTANNRIVLRVMSKFFAGDPDLRTIVRQKLLKNELVLIKKGLILPLKKLMTGVLYILGKTNGEPPYSPIGTFPLARGLYNEQKFTSS
jgi:hypothetical protein